MNLSSVGRGDDDRLELGQSRGKSRSIQLRAKRGQRSSRRWVSQNSGTTGMRGNLQATLLARDWQMVETRPAARCNYCWCGATVEKSRGGETHPLSKNGTDVRDSDPRDQNQGKDWMWLCSTAARTCRSLRPNANEKMSLPAHTTCNCW